MSAWPGEANGHWLTWSRLAIMLVTAGEAWCLFYLGLLSRDWGGAYLVVSAWLKDWLHARMTH